MSRRGRRHPFRGGRLFPRPSARGRARRASGRDPHRARHLRMRPRRSVNVAAFVAAPEEVPSRPRVRIRVVGAIVFVLFGVMALRLWDIQVINRHQYASAVTQDVLRTVTIPPPRGLIVDRRDTVLAGNKVENEVVLSRAEAASNPTIVGKVAALCGITPSAVRAALTDLQYNSYEPVPVLQNASPALVQYLSTHQAEFPGVTVVQVTVRDYPQGGTTATQVLGYTGPITATLLRKDASQGYTPTSQIGKTGVEAVEQRYLRGKPGHETIEVTPTGTPVGRPVRKTPPVQGDTVELNITAGLQKYAQQALTQDMAADRTDPTHGAAPNGAAVVLNAKTGAVLALASNPSYSLTEWVGGISTANYDALKAGCNVATGACPLNDYAIQGLYTPGSTFKLATATAALQDGLIGISTTIDDVGIFTVRSHGYPTCVGKCTFHDATAFDAGIITIRLALTESDDYFFYTLGLHFWRTRARYGATAIQHFAHEYGFGDLTGIDLPGEVQGRVDSQRVREALHAQTPKAFPNTSWYPATNLEMAFGQGETVITPIEEAVAYATFADHGIRHRPEVVGAIVTPGGRVVRRVAPKVTGHVTISTANYQAMLQGFIGVTHTPKGTAYAIFQQYSHVPSSYVIAGKTGTATTATSALRAPNAWFVGFGPIGAPTQYVVAVAVAQGGYGDQAAAPAVANIFNYLYAHPPNQTLTLPTATRQPSLVPTKSSTAARTPTTTTTTTPTVPATTLTTTPTTPASSTAATPAPTTTTTPATPAPTTTTTPATTAPATPAPTSTTTTTSTTAPTTTTTPSTTTATSGRTGAALTTREPRDAAANLGAAQSVRAPP